MLVDPEVIARIVSATTPLPEAAGAHTAALAA
jgi:hypothetical protein